MKITIPKWFMACILGVTLYVVLVGGGWLFLFQWAAAEERWSISKINEHICRMNTTKCVLIPSSSQNIRISGNTSRGVASLDLVFDAPYNDAIEFSKQFCQRLLYEGYDPFIATDTQTKLPGSYYIIQGYGGAIYHYYSSSLNTPNTTLGMRCTRNYIPHVELRADAALRIRVVRTDSNLLNVRFELKSSGAFYIPHQTLVGTKIHSETTRPWPTGQ